MPTTYFLPRDLHPAAWWLWALGLAAATSRTTNPYLLLTIVAVACHVVVARRSEAPWAMAFRLYLYLGLLIIAMRVFFRAFLGGAGGQTVVLQLPQIPLPDWAAGIRLLGDVSAEALLGGFYDGLRLATMVICLGAANALANPKRLLKSMPSALYEVGMAVVVAMSVFPQLAESVQRVRRARRLRGNGGKGIRALRSVVIPVLEDALDRSLLLASSMDSRGYGRVGAVPTRDRRTTGALMIVGLIGLCIGVYATLDATAPRMLAAPMLVLAIAVSLFGFRRAGRRVERTRYRPDRWRAAEILTAGSGIIAAVAVFATARLDPARLIAPVELAWPSVTWPPLLGLLLAIMPSFLTPPPRSPLGSEAVVDRLQEAVR